MDVIAGSRGEGSAVGKSCCGSRESDSGSGPPFALFQRIDQQQSNHDQGNGPRRFSKANAEAGTGDDTPHDSHTQGPQGLNTRIDFHPREDDSQSNQGNGLVGKGQQVRFVMSDGCTVVPVSEGGARQAKRHQEQPEK